MKHAVLTRYGSCKLTSPAYRSIRSTMSKKGRTDQNLTRYITSSAHGERA